MTRTSSVLVHWLDEGLIRAVATQPNGMDARPRVRGRATDVIADARPCGAWVNACDTSGRPVAQDGSCASAASRATPNRQTDHRGPRASRLFRVRHSPQRHCCCVGGPGLTIRRASAEQLGLALCSEEVRGRVVLDGGRRDRQDGTSLTLTADPGHSPSAVSGQTTSSRRSTAPP
jgi:hypothetical protein